MARLPLSFCGFGVGVWGWKVIFMLNPTTVEVEVCLFCSRVGVLTIIGEIIPTIRQCGAWRPTPIPSYMATMSSFAWLCLIIRPSYPGAAYELLVKPNVVFDRSQ